MQKQIQMQTASSTKKDLLADPATNNIYGGPTNEPSIIEKIDQQQEYDEHSVHKTHQPSWLFFLVCAMELLTIFLSILLLIVEKQGGWRVYLTYIILTVVRSIIFSWNSIKMVGFSKKLARLYFLLDNNLGMMAASDITYIFLNYRNQTRFAVGAMVCYPILMFFLVGNFRVMMVSCIWSSCQVVCYKLVKVIGATYFFVYGSFLLINSNIENSDLLLLWIFTASALWAGMYSTINALDESDHVVTRYVLTNE